VGGSTGGIEDCITLEERMTRTQKQTTYRPTTPRKCLLPHIGPLIRLIPSQDFKKQSIEVVIGELVDLIVPENLDWP